MLKINILKQLLKENRSFLLFLVKFLLCYLSITGVYNLFLRQYTIESNEVDGITTHVAELTKSVLAFFNQEIALTNHQYQPVIKVLYHQNPLFHYDAVVKYLPKIEDLDKKVTDYYKNNLILIEKYKNLNNTMD